MPVSEEEARNGPVREGTASRAEEYFVSTRPSQLSRSRSEPIAENGARLP